jgi:hypothetical protein
MSELSRNELCRLWNQRRARITFSADDAHFIYGFCDLEMSWEEAGARAGLDRDESAQLWRHLLEVAEAERGYGPSG